MRINAPVVLFQKFLSHSSVLPDLILRCIRKFEIGNQIVAFQMICDFHIQPPFFVLNCLRIRIKGLSPSSLYYNICKVPFTTNEPAAYVVFLQMRISAKIQHLPEMFTSTVHNIPHHPCTGI